VTWYERPLFENPFANYPKEKAFLSVKSKRKKADEQTWDRHRHLTWDEARWWLRTESIPWQRMAMDIGVNKF
jgi:zona occludens toxin (predicted ATPase)